MPRDSSGNYTLPPGNPVFTGTIIESDWANDTMSDLAIAMTDSLSRSGLGGMLAPLPFVDGSALTPSITFIQEETLGWYRKAPGTIGFAADGAQQFQYDANTQQFTLGFGTQPTSQLQPSVAGGVPRFRLLDVAGFERASLRYNDVNGDVSVQRRDVSGGLLTELLLENNGNVSVNAPLPIQLRELTRKDYVDTGLSNVSGEAAAAQATADQAIIDAAAAQATADTALANAATAQGTADQAILDASAAQGTADTALANAATAQAAADAAQGTADTALANANAAQVDATQALADAAAAQGTADTALANAATAQGTADTALTNAATAQAAAVAAQGTADTALANAATADGKAVAAQNTANQAVSDAAAAQGTANTANATANTALANAATAQGTADTALANAATADGKAVAAQGTADTALANAATADGKAVAAQNTANLAKPKADFIWDGSTLSINNV